METTSAQRQRCTGCDSRVVMNPLTDADMRDVLWDSDLDGPIPSNPVECPECYTIQASDQPAGDPNEFGGRDVTGPEGCARWSMDEAGNRTVYRFTRNLVLVWQASFEASAPGLLFDYAFNRAVAEVSAS